MSSNIAARVSASTASASSSVSDGAEAIADIQLDKNNGTTLKPSFRKSLIKKSQNSM